MSKPTDPLLAAIVANVKAGATVTFRPVPSEHTGGMLGFDIEAELRTDIPHTHDLRFDLDALDVLMDPVGAVADAVTGACEPVVRAAQRRRERADAIV